MSLMFGPKIVSVIPAVHQSSDDDPASDASGQVLEVGMVSVAMMMGTAANHCGTNVVLV